MNKLAQLIRCIECERQISSDARNCPHCGTHHTKGRKCAICCNVGKVSEGLWTSSYDWVHPACYEEVKREFQPVQYTCPVCNNMEAPKVETMGVLTKPFFTDPCPKCGHPLDDGFRARECSYCKTYVFPIVALRDREGRVIHRKCANTHKDSQSQNVSQSSGCLSTLIIVLSLLLLCVTYFL
jgi:hypothetical protein